MEENIILRSGIILVIEKKLAEHRVYESAWIVRHANKLFAAKRIDAPAEKRGKLRERLEKQVRFAEQIREHRIKGVCLLERMDEDSNGALWFLRPWVEGETLDQYLKESSVSYEKAVELMCKIADVVADAHAMGIVHGDLKPSNIVIGTGGIPFVIDWDSMRIGRSVEDATANGETLSTDQIVGTPAYMPLEQIQTGETDEASDTYALGVIFYEMLAGKNPFDGISALNMGIYKASNESPTLGNVPPKLALLVARLLHSYRSDTSEVPGGRLVSVESFRRELENVLETPAVDRMPSRVSYSRQPRKKGEKRRIFRMVGHVGSGKSVLAAGLYASRDVQFCVCLDTMSDVEANYIINLKTLLDTHQWPPPTGRNDKFGLRFVLRHGKGCNDSIEVTDYPGENLKHANFTDEITQGNPDGFLFLLNPGGEQFNNVRERNNLDEKFKTIAQAIARKDRTALVALIVTAADRLETDLKERKDEFNKFADGILQTLRFCNLKAKRFDVSVTGKLAKQSEPHLAPENVKEPFLWMCNVLNVRERNHKIAYILKMITASIAALMLTAGGIWGYEWKIAGDFSRTIDAIRQNGTDLDAVRDYHAALGNVWKATSPSFWFPQPRYKYDVAKEKLDIAFDRATFAYCEKLWDRAKEEPSAKDRDKGASPGNVKDLQENLEAWAPLTTAVPSEKMGKLKDTVKAGLPQLKINWLKTRLAALGAKPELKDLEEYLPQVKSSADKDLDNRFIAACKRNLEWTHQQWTSNLEKSPDWIPASHLADFKAKIVDQFSSRQEELKKVESENPISSLLTELEKDKSNVPTIEEKWQSRRVQEIAEQISPQSSVPDMVKTLESMKQLQKATPTAIKKSFQKFDSVVDSKIGAEHSKWEEKSLSEMTWKKPTWQEVFVPVFDKYDDRVVEGWKNKIDAMNKGTQKSWNDRRQKEFEDFKQKYQNDDAQSLSGALKEWAFNKKGHPYWKDIQNFSVDRFSEIINAQINKLHDGPAFKELQGICNAIIGAAKSGAAEVIHDSRPLRFSERYVKWMKSNPEVEMIMTVDFEVSTGEEIDLYVDGYRYYENYAKACRAPIGKPKTVRMDSQVTFQVKIAPNGLFNAKTFPLKLSPMTKTVEDTREVGIAFKANVTMTWHVSVDSPEPRKLWNQSK